MKLLKEHLKIIECFFSDNYSIEEVSEILSISEHKIRRYLNELYSHYKVINLENLKKKLGPNWRAKLKTDLDISSLDRRNFIILNFLKTDFINLNTLSLNLNITRRTLSKDLLEVKQVLNAYDLKCDSLNSKGIQLIGNENKKKEMFLNIIFVLFLDRNYLPNIFDFIFFDFNKIIDEKIQSMINKIILKKQVFPQSQIMLRFELIVFIGIIRSSNKFNIYSFKFEIKNILSLCKMYNSNDFFKNSYTKFKKIDDFINYLQTHLLISNSFNETTYISLLARFNLIEFKNSIKMNEFYLINREFEKKHKSFYYTLNALIQKYFKENFDYEIDSFDKITFFLILKDYLFLKNTHSKENIIVFNTLQLLILNKLIIDLKRNNIFISEAISIYSLKSYLKNNIIKNILIFEDINLEDFIELDKKITITKASFPLNDGDFLYIKSNFNL